MEHLILVLCHGNVNRSPAIEGILKKAGLNAFSGGFMEGGRRMAKKMREAMAGEIDQDFIDRHRSTKVTEEMVKKATHVIVFDARNERMFVEQFPQFKDKLRPALKIKDPGFMAKGSQEFKDIVSVLKLVGKELTKTYGN